MLPIPPLRRGLTKLLVWIAESWIGVNSALFDALTPTRWEITGLEGLEHRGSYLVICNHQSWVDIPVLQKVLNRRVPFLRFFLKQQLIWVPLLGIAWWALDFPFMKRLTREQLAKRPELRGSDLAATRRACAKFRQMPVSVMNFIEGTRFTPAKHDRQQSPYRHLLKPKSGGVAFVLDAMGDALHGLLDVTVAYPDGRPTMADLLAGRVPRIRVDIRQRALPNDLIGADYENNREARTRFQAWVNGLWEEKDKVLQRMLAD